MASSRSRKRCEAPSPAPNGSAGLAVVFAGRVDLVAVDDLALETASVQRRLQRVNSRAVEDQVGQLVRRFANNRLILKLPDVDIEKATELIREPVRVGNAAGIDGDDTAAHGLLEPGVAEQGVGLSEIHSRRHAQDALEPVEAAGW